MRFYLISDNTDTLVGMRLAGITGVLAYKKEEVKEVLEKAIKMENVAVILITERLVSLCEDLIYNLKLTCQKPLILEIPDRHSNGRSENSILKYVRNSIGLKI